MICQFCWIHHRDHDAETELEGKNDSVGRTGDSKQSFVACRDNHCKAPLSHSLRIKPTGLICGPTEYTHTHTLTHTHAHTSKHLHNTWTALLLSIFTLHHTCFPFFLSPAQTNTPLAPSHTLAPPVLPCVTSLLCGCMHTLKWTPVNTLLCTWCSFLHIQMYTVLTGTCTAEDTEIDVYTYILRAYDMQRKGKLLLILHIILHTHKQQDRCIWKLHENTNNKHKNAHGSFPEVMFFLNWFHYFYAVMLLTLISR